MYKNKLLKMRHLIWMNGWYFLGATMALLLAILMDFVTPILLGETVDRFLLGGESTLPAWANAFVDWIGGPEWVRRNLWSVGLCIVLASLLSGAFYFIKSRLSSVACESIGVYLRDQLYTRIQKLPYNYHVKSEAGDLIQRCTSDVETMRAFLGDEILEIISSLFTIFVALVYLLQENVSLTLWCLCLTPALFLFAWLFFNWVSKSFAAADEADGTMNAVLQENLTGVRVVRAFGRQKFEVDKFDRASKDLRNKSFNMSKLLAVYWSGSELIGRVQLLITLILCVIYVVRGELTLGGMIVFTTYINTVLWPIRQMGGILSDAGKSSVAMNRIREILTQPIEPEEKDALTPPLDGDIVFDHVTFGYDGGRVVMNDMSFTIPAGKTTAILGATGCGKSSLVHLLQRLYDVEKGKGTVSIGGVDIRSIDRKYLRTRVGLVLQENFLYSRTLKENISIAVPGATDEMIDRAVTDACAKDFILKSDKGFDTVVGERGVTLSGGQKQRIAIARTLIKDSDILIFDDSLSAVDTETDAAIRKALKKRSKNVTTLIISHRVTTLSQADHILVMEDGRITQQGSHDELVKQPGLYSRIFNIQSSQEASPPAPPQGC